MNAALQTGRTAGPIELFRPGAFKPMEGAAVSFSAGDFRALANLYDPEEAPAPVVIGHPEVDAPAFGWMDHLFVDNGILKGTIRDLAPSFAEAVRDGRYKRISISLFEPQSSSKPEAGPSVSQACGVSRGGGSGGAGPEAGITGRWG